MIVLGSNSEVAQAFVEEMIAKQMRYPMVYLFTSNEENTRKFAQHLKAKYLQESQIILWDLTKNNDDAILKEIDSNLLISASGYLGKSTEEGLYDNKNTQLTIDINYGKLVPLINYFASKMESKREGTIIGISSVAGERGRQSNFIYGSSKAAYTTYLSGLRNYLTPKNVHVITVLPGFMDTKMTEGLALNPKLTASPKQAAKLIVKAFQKQKNIVYVLPIWWAIMTIIKNIPEFIFKKLKL